MSEKFQVPAAADFQTGGGSAPPAPLPRPDPYVGTTFDGRYVIESVLGEGGMGVVYLARHRLIDKRVAVKVLRSEMAREREITERFLQEAKSASSIGNAHIIDISDFGHLPDGSTYFVMEYLDGQPLSRLLNDVKPIPISRLIHISVQIAEGLAAAHARGIVHRDLKPDNLFLIPRGAERDFVKILDFGIAKVSSVNTKLTRAGSVFGTPHYMSPEQAAGSPVDLRTDIYALGVILYEMASGKVPFDADNFMGILTQHMYKAPVPIRALVPPPQNVPPGLEAIILKALSKKPEQRYATMMELAEDLQRLKQGQVPNAVPEMMGRSGAYHVSADMRGGGGMPAPMPATPMNRGGGKRWGVIGGLTGAVAAIAIVIGIFAKSSSGRAHPGDSMNEGAPHPIAISTAIPAASGPSAIAGAEVTASKPVVKMTKQVTVASDPLDAHIFSGNRDLGVAPVTVDVPDDGNGVAVDVRRDGFRGEHVLLDGAQTRVGVHLARVGGSPSPASHAPAGKGGKGRGDRTTGTNSATPSNRSKAGGLGGAEVIDPWSH